MYAHAFSRVSYSEVIGSGINKIVHFGSKSFVYLGSFGHVIVLTDLQVKMRRVLTTVSWTCEWEGSIAHCECK